MYIIIWCKILRISHPRLFVLIFWINIYLLQYYVLTSYLGFLSYVMYFYSIFHVVGKPNPKHRKKENKFNKWWEKSIFLYILPKIFHFSSHVTICWNGLWFKFIFHLILEMYFFYSCMKYSNFLLCIYFCSHTGKASENNNIIFFKRDSIYYRSFTVKVSF